MARRAALIVALASAFLPLFSLGAVPPRPAPAVYASPQYVLTFRSPRGTAYCPLPAGWVGSDHGTILFLEPPRDCGDAGYPSISRGFTPETVARIDVYYGYALDEARSPTCRKVGRLVLLGRARALCRTDQGGMIALEASAPYSAGTSAEAALTLWSRPARVAHDLATLRRLAASVRTCTTTYRNPPGTSHRWGSGPACARSGWF